VHRIKHTLPMFALLLAVALGIAISVAFRSGDPASVPAPQSTTPPPNIVIILVDTLRPSYLGLYGHEPETAPFLARMSLESAVFERAISTSSWTAPSVASLFTSLYPHDHGVILGAFLRRAMARTEGSADGPASMPVDSIADSVATLPELMKRAGYSTFGIATNWNVSEEFGFGRGFDRFENIGDKPLDKVYDLVQTWQPEITNAPPYFLYLHLMDPHRPYRKNPPYFEQYAPLFPADPSRAQYLSEVTFTDIWLEKLFAMLELEKNNSLVVFLSDHGEEFGDHGHTGHEPYLYDELQRVVMMWYGPKAGVRPGRFGMNVSLIDVLPTLAKSAAFPVPDHAAGVSLWPLISGVPDAGRAFAWDARVLLGHRINTSVQIDLRRDADIPRDQRLKSLSDGHHWSATQGKWKYIEHVGRTPELYDLVADPLERTNLADAQPDVTTSLAAEIAAARITLDQRKSTTTQVQVDDDLKQKLKALGYVD
jgi:arylsulfatase A-like enzyme